MKEKTTGCISKKYLRALYNMEKSKGNLFKDYSFIEYVERSRRILIEFPDGTKEIHERLIIEDELD